MKKLFLLVFIVSVVGVATAEVIDSVSFNPSRLGRYEHLKVSDKLDVGCLTTQSMMLDVGCRVTMNYSGSSAVDIGCAYVSGVDMDDETTMYVPSVYLIGGTTETNGDVKLNGNLQAPEATSVYTRTLNLPNHTVRVNGGGKLWDGENSSDKSFVLGGNNIPSPQSGDCESLAWFTRKDDNTGANFKVLGCNPKQKEAKCQVLWDFGTAPSPGTDTCDGNNYGWYSGTCTEAMLAKGSCTDYYNIGSQKFSMTGEWTTLTTDNKFCATSNYEQNSCDLNCKKVVSFARNQGDPTAACNAALGDDRDQLSCYASPGLCYYTKKGGNYWYRDISGYICNSSGNDGCTNNPWFFPCWSFTLRCTAEIVYDTRSLYRNYTFKTVYE